MIWVFRFHSPRADPNAWWPVKGPPWIKSKLFCVMISPFIPLGPDKQDGDASLMTDPPPQSRLLMLQNGGKARQIAGTWQFPRYATFFN